MAIINGTEDNDILTGATIAVADTINGLGGNDDLTAGEGDTLNGGAGDDILRAASAGAPGRTAATAWTLWSSTTRPSATAC
jgi:Ca2+-binding RTX toxin-like protein